MKIKTANTIGFLISTLMPSILMVVKALILKDLSSAFKGLWILILFYPWTVIFTIFLGIPLYLLIQHLKLIRWWSLTLEGCLLGLLMGFMLFGNHHYLLLGSFGMISGYVFWLIWRLGDG